MSWITDRVKQEKLLPKQQEPTPEEYTASIVNNAKELLEHMATGFPEANAQKICAVRNYLNSLWPQVLEYYPELNDAGERTRG